MNFNYITLSIGLLLAATSLIGQATYDIPARAAERLRLTDVNNQTERLDPGDTLTLKGVRLGVFDKFFHVQRAGVDYQLSLSDIGRLAFDVEGLSKNAIWRLHYLKSEAIGERAKGRSWQPTREALEEEYVELYQSLELADDPLLSDYLNELILQLMPEQWPEGDALSVRVRAFQAAQPLTYSTVSGRIYISTGMLAHLRSEAELMAVLASELAHIYLCHQLINYSKLARSEARAAFWTGVLTVAAALAEVAVTINEIDRGTYSPVDLYTAGGFTESVYLLSSDIAYRIANRIGTEYTSTQQDEADAAAQAVFKSLGKDPKALSSALLHILQYDMDKKKVAPNYQRGFYGSLSGRAARVGDGSPPDLAAFDAGYVRKTALARLSIAWREYGEGSIDIAQRLLDLQFAADAALLEDYILQSMIIRRQSADKERMQAAMLLLRQGQQQAYSLTPDLHLEKAMLHIRLDETEAAIQELTNYRKALEQSGGDQARRL